MSEIKWIRVSTELFDDAKIKIIKKLPDGNTIILLWLYLLIQAGKVNDNGKVYFSQGVPMNEETLATVTDTPVNTVRLAMQTFIKFCMISETPGGLLITNWEKHQNIAMLDKIREDTRKRVQKFRENQKLLQQGSDSKNDNANNCNKDSEAVTLQKRDVTVSNALSRSRSSNGNDNYKEEVEETTTTEEIFYSFKNNLRYDGIDFENEYLKFCENYNGKQIQNIELACHKWLDSAVDFQNKYKPTHTAQTGGDSSKFSRGRFAGKMLRTPEDIEEARKLKQSRIDNEVVNEENS